MWNAFIGPIECSKPVYTMIDVLWKVGNMLEALIMCTVESDCLCCQLWCHKNIHIRHWKNNSNAYGYIRKLWWEWTHTWLQWSVHNYSFNHSTGGWLKIGNMTVATTRSPNQHFGVHPLAPIDGKSSNLHTIILIYYVMCNNMLWAPKL